MPEHLKEVEEVAEQGTLQQDSVTEELPETGEAPVDETGPSDTEEQTAEPLEAVVQRLEQENETLQNNFLRLKADLENVRRRNQTELASVRQTASEGLVGRLLPVLDNLERAVAAPAENEGWKKGVEMVLRQFQEVLAQEGVEPISAVGEVFNPQVHEAVMAEPADVPEGTILAEMEKGYSLNGKVIRFSKVKVAN